MRTRFILLAAALAAPAARAQEPQTAPASAPAEQAAAYTTRDTPIGTLLDDPGARAVIDRHLPGFSANPQVQQARAMTLKAVQPYAPQYLTDQVLADIDAELAKLPARR